MTDRPCEGEAPGPEEGVAACDRGVTGHGGEDGNRPDPRPSGIRADGGAPAGRLFAAMPDPAVRYELDGDSPAVAGVNAAYEERFDVDADVAGPLETRLRTDLERAEPGEGFARIDDIVELVESAAAGSHLRAVVRASAPGGERDYLARVVPLSGTDDGGRAGRGQAADGCLLLTDITAQLERTRDLVAQRDRLDDFASIVSHDLRNPLEVAKIQLEAARMRDDEVHFEKVADAHERMEQIVEDVLTLARQGQVIDEVADVSLESVARDAWDAVSAPSATMTVEEDVVLAADGDRLQELIENLFRNAVEHAGPTVTVTVGATPDGFYVADDGPGIPEDDKESAFEGGFSTRTDGTGLGLAIVDRIAEAHGWSIDVRDAEGGGARFDVSHAEVARTRS